MELPSEYNITNTFNIGDLHLHKQDQEFRSILSKEGGVEPCAHASPKSCATVNHILAHGLAKADLEDINVDKNHHEHHKQGYSTATIMDHAQERNTAAAEEQNTAAATATDQYIR